MGVEGIDTEVLTSLLKEADVPSAKKEKCVSYYEFYSDGFAGGLGSAKKRERSFGKKCSLPEKALGKRAFSRHQQCSTRLREYRKLKEQ